jgi:hypothetical protein
MSLNYGQNEIPENYPMSVIYCSLSSFFYYLNIVPFKERHSFIIIYN